MPGTQVQYVIELVFTSMGKKGTVARGIASGAVNAVG